MRALHLANEMVTCRCVLNRNKAGVAGVSDASNDCALFTIHSQVTTAASSLACSLIFYRKIAR